MRAENLVFAGVTNMRFVDIFGRQRNINLTNHGIDLMLHESGRIYKRRGKELRLVGSYNEPVFDKARPHLGCAWKRTSRPCMFEGDGALLGWAT